MAYTKNELAAELWMLTKGMLQDSRIDTDEARVVKRWFEEHREGEGASFDGVIATLDRFLADGFIAPHESQRLIDSLGSVLANLRK